MNRITPVAMTEGMTLVPQSPYGSKGQGNGRGSGNRRGFAPFGSGKGSQDVSNRKWSHDQIGTAPADSKDVKDSSEQPRE